MATRQLIKNVLAFYGTVGIPLMYVVGLWCISKSGGIEFSMSLRLINLFLVAVGIIVWVSSYVSLGKSFGVLPGVKKAVTRGLYKRHKHPMYIGIMLVYLGLSVANQSSNGLFFTVLILAPILCIRAKLEEKKLTLS